MSNERTSCCRLLFLKVLRRENVFLGYSGFARRISNTLKLEELALRQIYLSAGGHVRSDLQQGCRTGEILCITMKTMSKPATWRKLIQSRGEAERVPVFPRMGGGDMLYVLLGVLLQTRSGKPSARKLLNTEEGGPQPQTESGPCPSQTWPLNRLK